MTRSKRVLVVEDDGDQAEILSKYLARAGYVVESAPDATTAVRAMERAAPDAIVLDVMLPGTDGYHICFQLRHDPRFARIPVLMLTCMSEAHQREKGMLSGADEYLAKPAPPERVIEALERLIARGGGTK